MFVEREFTTYSHILREQGIAEFIISGQSDQRNERTLGILHAGVCLVKRIYQLPQILFSQAAVELIYFRPRQQVISGAVAVQIYPPEKGRKRRPGNKGGEKFQTETAWEVVLNQKHSEYSQLSSDANPIPRPQYRIGLP